MGQGAGAWASESADYLALEGRAQGHGLWGLFPELVVIAINTPLLLFLK